MHSLLEERTRVVIPDLVLIVSHEILRPVISPLAILQDNALWQVTPRYLFPDRSGPTELELPQMASRPDQTSVQM